MDDTIALEEEIRGVETSPPPSKSHPKGLYVLFTTEMWERFNFYGMRAILTLFLVNALTYSDQTTSLIYGGFLGLCYLTPMLGGFISDRFLGNRNCIMLGGLTMAVGQLLLFISASQYHTDLGFAQNITWVALGVIVLGNGFFKPNISSMVGSLYPPKDNRLDSAFTIFYLGINLGALIGNYICSTVGDVKNAAGIRDVSAFKYGFLAASLAMVLGTAIFFFLKNKYIVTPEGKAIGGLPKNNTSTALEEDKAEFSSQSIGIWVFIALALISGFHFIFGNNWIYSVIYSSGISLAGLILTDKKLTKIETQRIWVIYIVGLFIMFFWACFEQAGSSLTFIADKQTDTHLFGWEMPPSAVQNFNGFFILIFAFPFSWMWIQLNKRKLEPISPVKQSIGLLLLALGYFIIANRVKTLGIDEKMGIVWLIILYLLHTLGELCLSPIGLSLVAKLSPKRFSSLLFGVFFLSNASGYALAGTLGALIPNTSDKFIAATSKGINLQGILDGTVVPTADQVKFLDAEKIATVYPKFVGFTIHNLYEFFMVFVILPASAAVLLFLLSGKLKKMMNGIR